ncbi:MAG: hypothetical protein IPN74_04420 [Haliscomenobacter sp.]|nr:hypothetical protein [Haliscomenobacter sp.]
MIRNLFISFLVFTVLACQQNQKPANTQGTSEAEPATGAPPKNDFIIVPGQRVGPFTSDAVTETDLVEAFGEANVEAASIGVGEGFELPGFKIFPGTKNELEVAYDPDADPNRPAFIRVSQEGTPWKTDAGVKLGITLQELQQLNGKPFLFSGFGWDYGGRVTDWKGGAFNANLMISLDNFSENAPEDIFGDREISSDNPMLKRLKIQVWMMEVRI